jgi:hypothetical protein
MDLVRRFHNRVMEKMLKEAVVLARETKPL